MCRTTCMETIAQAARERREARLREMLNTNYGNEPTVVVRYGRKRCNGCRRLKTAPWPRGYPAARCMAEGWMRGAVIGRRPTDDYPVYRPAWCPGKEDDVERRV